MKRPLIAPARATLLMLAALVQTLTVGCGSNEEPSGATVVKELRGDTVVMVSSGEPDRVIINEVEVLWQSAKLEHSGRHWVKMDRLGDHLLILDMNRVHVVSFQDGTSHTFGRRGQGPGEFRGSARSVGGFGPDTIAVFDEIQVYLFSLDGEFLTSYQPTERPPFIRAVFGGSAADRPA